MRHDFYSVYCTPFFITTALIFMIYLFATSRLRARGAWYMTMVCLAASLWSFTEGMLYLRLNLETRVFFTQCQYFGIAPMLPLTLLFVMTIFGFNEKTIQRLQYILFTVAAAIVLAVWGNPLHQMIFTDFRIASTGFATMLAVDHGPLWWVIIAYHYTLVVGVSVILLKKIFAPSPLQRSQARVLLVAVASVWIANLVYVTGSSPVPHMDISPIAFSLVAAAMAWGVLRTHLLDILPIARAEVFRGLADAVLVFDNRLQIIDFNPAAAVIFNLSRMEDTVNEAPGILDRYPVLKRIAEAMRHSEVPIRHDGHRHFYDVRVSAMTSPDGYALGRIMVLRDITERRRAEEKILISENRYRQIFQLAPVGILEVDYRNRRIVDVNEEVCDYLGYSRQELTAMDVLELLTPEGRIRFQLRLDRIARGEDVPRTESFKALRKDGSERRLTITARFVYDGSTIVGETMVAQQLPAECL